MSEQINVSPAPIIPSLPQIEPAKNPITAFQNPGLIDAQPKLPLPVIPNGVPPMVEARPILEGDTDTGPRPKKSANTLDYVRGVQQAMKDPNLTKDRYKYGRAYTYGSGYKQMNFERYYTHPKYKDLGFSPYRDNDAHYNANSSWWDDFNRMRTQWGNIAFSAFTDMLPFGSDEHASADAMEKGMAIGSSTRGGAGAWVTNFGLQSAYTVGIMGEIIAENIALAALEFGTAGGASGIVAAREAMLFRKAIKGFEKLSDIIKSFKQVDTAKDFWKTINITGNTKDFVKWAMPFEGTRDLIRTGGNLDKLKPLAAARKTFGTFYKDMRELSLVSSEALLEGQSASNTYQQKLLDEFYVKNGRMPNDQEAQLIYQKGESMKGTVSFANDLTIYFTNKLVFKDLLKGFSINQFTKKAFLEGGKKTLGTVSAQTWKTGTDVTAVTQQNIFMRTGKSLLTSSYAPWSRKYFLANLSEGLQESSQEVINKAAEFYYDKIDSDPSQAGLIGSLNAIGQGVESQFSAQGFDTFIQGYLMGSIVQGGTGILTGSVKKGADYIKGNQIKDTEEQRTNEIRNSINAIVQDAGVFGQTQKNSETLGTVNTASKEKAQADENGDELHSKNMQAEMENTHYIRLASSGSTKVLTNFIDEMLQLSDEDLVDAYKTEDNADLTADKIRTKLTKSKATAESVDKKYKILKNKMPNPFEPWKIDKNKNPQEYLQSVAEYMAHEDLIEDLIFNTQMYEDVVDRMRSINNNLAGRGTRLQNFFRSFRGGDPIANTNANYVQALTDDNIRASLIQTNKEQIEILKTGTSEQKKKAKELEAINTFLTAWSNTVENYQANINSAKKAPIKESEREAIQARSRMQKNAIVKDKRGREWVVVSSKGNRVLLKNEEGAEKETYKRRLELLDDSKVVKPSQFAEIEGDEISGSISEMYDIFEGYIKQIAAMDDSYVMGDQLNQAFAQIKDLYALNSELRDVINSVNVLSDPNYYQRFISMKSQVNRLRKERQLENLKKALSIFKRRAELNNFLNALYDLGVFVMEDDINKLLNFEMVRFFDASTMQPVDPTSKKYTDILDVVEDYADKWQVQVTGKVTPQFKRWDPKYSYTHRKRNEDDKRTEADFGKQYKFDPKSAKTEVSAADVLQTIIDSPHTTPREKALARRLLTTVRKEAVITFVNNGDSAGTYNAETNEVIIDPRYSSIDYAIGERSVPFETTILRNYVSSLVSSSLSTDSVFKEKIEKLIVAAKAHLKSKNQKELIGVSNPEEFIKEAMTSEIFQQMLEEIPYEVTGKPSNLWIEFITVLTALLKNIVNTNKSNTALDEALHIITSKIDAPAPMPSAPGTTTQGVTPAQEVRQDIGVRVGTSSEEIRKRDPLLFNELVNAYRTWPGVRDEVKNIATNGTIDEIAVLEDFDNFVEASDEAATIIKKYQKPVAKVPETKPQDKWTVGNKFYFSGIAFYEGKLQNLNELPVEVVENNGVIENEEGQEHPILLKDVNTGNLFSIDLLSDESAGFIVASQPTVTKGVEKAVVEEDDQSQSAKYVVKHNIKSRSRISVEQDSKTGEITVTVNPQTLKTEYDQKIWATSRRIGEGIYMEPLHVATFTSYAEYEAYVIERTVLEKLKMTKTMYDKRSGGKRTKLEYQEYITDLALRNTNIEKRSLVEGETQYTSEELDELYASISSGKDLDNWYNIVRNSGKFTSDQLRDMYNNAKNNLAKVNMKNLTVKKVVKMKNGKLMVVRMNNGVEVHLVPVESFNDPNVEVTILKKKQLNKIDMIHHDFIETEVVETITEEDKKDIQKGMSDVATIEEEQMAILDEVEKLTPEQVNAKLKDAFNNCKF